mmetsp:Transcript_64776/g.120548  ORF Transcript_64776/g.120548 Transcript_64776/m.120548 type:complete len:301 (+) Transcript_64776:136-1038(+)
MSCAIFSAFSSRSVALSTGNLCIKARVFSSTSFIASKRAAKASSGVFGVLSSWFGACSIGSSTGAGSSSAAGAGAAGTSSTCGSAGGALSVLGAAVAVAATFFAASSILFLSCTCSRSCCFHSLRPALSAACIAIMFSSFIDLTSSLPPSRRSSTSHRPLRVGCGSCLCTTPRLPFKYGAFRKPCIRTIALATRSVGEGRFGGSHLGGSARLGVGATTGGAAGAVSTAEPYGWAFRFSVADSPKTSGPLFRLVSLMPSFSATNLCISAVPVSKFKRWASAKSLCAFFQLPNLRCAMPLTR